MGFGIKYKNAYVNLKKRIISKLVEDHNLFHSTSIAEDQTYTTQTCFDSTTNGIDYDYDYLASPRLLRIWFFQN